MSLQDTTALFNCRKSAVENWHVYTAVDTGRGGVERDGMEGLRREGKKSGFT